MHPEAYGPTSLTLRVPPLRLTTRKDWKEQRAPDGCRAPPVFFLCSASSTFLPSTCGVLGALPAGGPSPVPRLSPSSQNSQGPQCYCFQLKKKNISSPLSPPLPFSSALHCQRSAGVGKGALTWGTCSCLSLQQPGKAFPHPCPNSSSAQLGSGHHQSLGVTFQGLPRVLTRDNTTCHAGNQLRKLEAGKNLNAEMFQVNSRKRKLMVLTELETLFLLDRDSDKC